MCRNALIVLGTGCNQIPLIQRSLNKGYFVIGVDRDPNTSGRELVDLFINISTYNADRRIESLDNLRSDYNFCGVIARSSGPALKTAAILCKEYKLTWFTQEFIDIASVKSELRIFCQKRGITSPNGALNYKEIKIQNPNYPLIIKPDYPTQGKKNIFYIASKEEVKALLSISSGSSVNNSSEIEEYIPGFDVSLLVFIKSGNVKPIILWDELVVINTSKRIEGVGIMVIKGGSDRTTVQSIIDIVYDTLEFKVDSEWVKGRPANFHNY